MKQLIPISAFALSNVEVGFSPDRTSLPLVLKVINSSKSSICLAAYSFTSKPVAEALYNAKNRGVSIQIVADSRANSGHYSAVNYLANHGINVRLNSKYAIMHNKFMIIDNQTVQTGSFNYSAAAVNKNAENVLVMWNYPDIAAKYNSECKRLYNEAESVLPKSY